MIPIKFRGKRIDNGKFVYGDVAYTALGVLMGGGYEVKPQSIKQLVGYAKNRHAVYQGDVMLDKQGNEYVAQLRPCVVRKTPLGEDIHFDVDAFNLKEETP